MLLADLDRSLSGRKHGPLHEQEWQEIFHNVVRPLIKQPRDARRYINAVVAAVDMLGEEVALEDVLGLEAVRVFLPDVYEALGDYADVLAMNEMGFTPDRHSHQQ